MGYTRGFITIATGSEQYYRIARNLLYSYRYWAKEAYPFAIIADRENEYTKEFDDVIIISDPSNSYMDKLKLFRELPYDETIFIDADSLVYGDINEWWPLFAEGGDFSVFGFAWRDLNSRQGWFVPSGMKEYEQLIAFIPSFNGGVYYMRNTDTCRKVFEIALYAAQNYSNYAFCGFKTAADEPVLALGMAVCGCEPLDLPELAFAPRPRQIELDISRPCAIYKRKKDHVYPVRLIHWSNYYTRKSLYRFEVSKLLQLRNNPKCVHTLSYKVLYKYKVLLRIMYVYDISSFCYRIKNKIMKLIRRVKV